MASFLLVALLSTSLRLTTIHGWFYMNQEIIAETLCFEKDVDGSTCNGLCQLEHMVEETAPVHHESPIPESFNELTLQWHCQTQLLIPGFEIPSQTPHSPYAALISEAHILQLIRPPRC